MKLTSKVIAWLTITSTLGLNSCSNNDTYIPPKEGDVVMWWGNQLLIIKAVLGQRRQHVEKSLAYSLEHENFIGQFPIDYDPKPFPKLTEEDAKAFEAVEEKRLKKLNHPMHNDIEFYLMLNGSQVKPTNLNPISEGLDHPDQVKVIISRIDLYHENFSIKRGELNKNYHKRLEMQNENTTKLLDDLNMSTKSTRNGVSCYEYIERMYIEEPVHRCFVKSDSVLAPDYHFFVGPRAKRNPIQVIRYAAGFTLFWYTDRNNIYRAKEIDAAIWRLLEAWNVSPYQAPTVQ